jgi:cellulose synthase/poly-beta-1,6-N-acetylglucosamine synthase-like glycosyltransferase
VVLHRHDRHDFKAGALQAAIAQSPHDYFAVLDVDYVPHPDFLRRCMTVLIDDPSLAFVQARPDYLNSGENMMTRAQTLMLDYHYGLEQVTRSWAGVMLPFNGTCGIWRRAAIEAGGGWHGDTLNEDWDLSYRAWNNGWRGIFLNSVGVPGELPTRFRTWTVQQQRWASGIGQVALKLVPDVFRNTKLSSAERWGGLFPLIAWFGHAMFIVTLFLAIATLLLKPSYGWQFALFVYIVYLCGWTALFWNMRVANRFVGRGTSLIRYIVDFQIVPYLSLYVCWANLRSIPATFMRRRRVFVRTPKRG